MADEAVCCSQFQTSSEPNASGCVCSLIGASRTRTFSRMVTTYIAAANSRQSPMLCRLLLIPAILGIAELMHGSASAARRRLAASLEQLAIQARRELPHELLRPLARAESDAHRLTSASVSGSSPKAATVSRYGAAALQPGSRHAVAASCDAVWVPRLACAQQRRRGAACPGAGAEKPGSDSM